MRFSILHLISKGILFKRVICSHKNEFYSRPSKLRLKSIAVLAILSGTGYSQQQAPQFGNLFATFAQRAFEAAAPQQGVAPGSQGYSSSPFSNDIANCKALLHNAIDQITQAMDILNRIPLSDNYPPQRGGQQQGRQQQRGGWG
jgi:hypothetical protein